MSSKNQPSGWFSTINAQLLIQAYSKSKKKIPAETFGSTGIMFWSCIADLNCRPPHYQ